jgi:hypothetical protein
MTGEKAGQPLLLTNVKPMAFGGNAASGTTDILVGADGRISAIGSSLAAPAEAIRVDGKGAFISPGWIDLHVHIWHGGTDISIRPSECGAERGVTTLVDAGSAGEANFHGFREYIIEPSRERIKAFLNLGSIGLVACNRVAELRDIRDIDLDRILECYAENKEHIVGIKVRASHVITGSWGVTPVKLGKKIAKILKVPMMVHVGEPPALYDEVLEILGPGDVVTHCFNGKAGSSIMEDEDLYNLAERCAGEGIRLDIGHGGASFSFQSGGGGDRPRTAALFDLDRPARPFDELPGLGPGDHHVQASVGRHAVRQGCRSGHPRAGFGDQAFHGKPAVGWRAGRFHDLRSHRCRSGSDRFQRRRFAPPETVRAALRGHRFGSDHRQPLHPTGPQARPPQPRLLVALRRIVKSHDRS